MRDLAFEDEAHKLLWLPPSLPYYEPQGPYKHAKNFSKILVFSAWEMVPRAIATLLSYESERLSIGELIKRTPKNKKENRSYFAKNRFPNPRIKFAIKDDEPANMNHLCLAYPSVTLMNLFDPIDALNQQLSLSEIKDKVRNDIKDLLDQLEMPVIEDSNRQDERWYYLAPMLLDLDNEKVNDWIRSDEFLSTLSLEDDSQDEAQIKSDKLVFIKHFEKLKDYYLNGIPVLGRKPDDLVEVLTDMVLGSPTISALRMFNHVNSATLGYAVQIGKSIIDRFNTQEATAVVELEYGSRKVHWKSILKYSIDGNIQAMMDEYRHMLLEEGGLKNVEIHQQNLEVTKKMVKGLNAHSASYNVDTYQGFKQRAKGKSKEQDSMKMRTNFAVGFLNVKSQESSDQRKDSIRLAFNSPFRPFVLATTSIGQEGLDFHYYCRKIVHWNLPSNPIDIEQREGRINRYKGLVIRQNIAEKYKDLEFQSDAWKEMFDEANTQERNQMTSELVPYWCLPNHEGIKIERHVPMYPMSKDGAKYERLIKILTLYRLSLGQSRQEELLEYLFENQVDEEKLKDLFINLSPYYKRAIF